MIEHIYDQCRRNAILLAKIDEQARISRLGSTRAAFTALAAAFVTLGIAFFLACPALFRHFYLAGTAVVLEEMVELQRDDTLDEVLFVQPVELAVYLGQVGGYFLFIDLYLFYFVHHFEELLLAYFLSGGDFACDELFADDFLYCAHFAFLAHIDD